MTETPDIKSSQDLERLLGEALKNYFYSIGLDPAKLEKITYSKGHPQFLVGGKTYDLAIIDKG